MKANYFAHDYGSRNDPKLVALQMAMGGFGLGLFWCLIEMLWENGGYYPRKYEMIAYQLKWPKAEEVQRVVEEFGLFQADGEKFWSVSLQARMEARDNISASRAKSGREGGIRSGESRRDKANASRGGSESEALASEAGSNKDSITIKNDTNKLHAISEEEERMEILELFFFRNYHSPVYEAGRFWAHYSDAGWISGSGKPITDKKAIAAHWIPLNTENRFDARFLSWYKSIYSTAKHHLASDDVGKLLTDLTSARFEGERLIIAYKTREFSAKVKEFVLGNNLQGSNVLDWRVDV